MCATGSLFFTIGYPCRRPLSCTGSPFDKLRDIHQASRGTQFLAAYNVVHSPKLPLGG